MSRPTMQQLIEEQHRSRRTESLQERVTGGQPLVDRERGIIHQVRVLGAKSQNDGGKRWYPHAVMVDALPLYEGVSVNIDHPDRGNSADGGARSMNDIVGVLRNPKVARLNSEESAIYADLHFIRTHPLAETICEMAERFPRNFGLSHNADGEVSRRGERTIVESIRRVYSVDLVSTPATNKGLFESVDEAGHEPSRDYDEAKYPQSLEEFVSSTKGSGGYLLTQPGKPTEQASHDARQAFRTRLAEQATEADTAIKKAFRVAVLAVLDDDTLTIAQAMKKIKATLKQQDKVLGGPPVLGLGSYSETETDDELDLSLSSKDVDSEKSLEESYRPSFKRFLKSVDPVRFRRLYK